MTTANIKHTSHPFHALFLNLTRPNVDLKTIPYVILLQHSSSLHLRLTASDVSTDTNERNRSQKNEVTEEHIYKLASVMQPSVIARRDLSGSLIMKEAFHECIHLCDGFVILVSSTGWYDKDIFSQSSWTQNGVHVDLSLNPFEWDENHKSSSEINLDSIIQQKICKSKCKMTARVDSLKSILSTIQNAVVIVQKLQEANKQLKESNAIIKPIPIIFDSISLLLRLNGPHDVLSFLNNLKHIHTLNRNSNLASPIFIPVLNETISQSYHRSFEDLSDATLTINHGQLLIARRSTRGGGMFSSSLGPCGRKLVREVQAFEINQEGDVQWSILEKDSETSKQDIISVNESQTISSAGSKKLTIQSSPLGKNDRVLLLNDDGPRPSIHPSSSILSNETIAIYMDHDDPEFLDDPDDDLDL